MKFDKLNEAKELLRASDTLRKIRPKYLADIAHPRCDKYDMRFGGDDRFSVFSVNVRFICYTGYYGNSSCSTFDYVDNTIASRLLNVVLNRNMGEILSQMAGEAKREAVAIRDAAKAELKEADKFLDRLLVQEEEP